MASEVFISWPEELRDLIDELQTIEALDVMCLAGGDPSTPWRVDQLVTELGADRYVVDEAVAHLVELELLARRPDGTVQYAIRSPKRHAMMTVLRNLCQDDRANVLGAIAQLSVDRIRSSAARTFGRRSPRDRR